MPFQFIDRDPLELEKARSAAQGKIALNNIYAQQDLAGMDAANKMALANMELQARRESPEWQLAKAKLGEWGNLTPEERKQTMGIKSQTEQAIQEQHLKNLQLEPGFKQAELDERRREAEARATEWGYHREQANKQYELHKTAMGWKYDEMAENDYNKQWLALEKMKSGMGNKNDIANTVESFLYNTSTAVSNPNISAYKAIELGSKGLNDIMLEARKKGLDPARMQRLQEIAAGLQQNMLKRAQEPDPTTGEPNQAHIGMATSAVTRYKNMMSTGVPTQWGDMASNALTYGGGALGAWGAYNMLARKMGLPWWSPFKNRGGAPGAAPTGEPTPTEPTAPTEPPVPENPNIIRSSGWAKGPQQATGQRPPISYGPKVERVMKGGYSPGMQGLALALLSQFLPDWDPLGLKAKYPVMSQEEFNNRMMGGY